MQKFAPSASRLPQVGQKFRGAAARADDVTGTAVGGVTMGGGTRERRQRGSCIKAARAARTRDAVRLRGRDGDANFSLEESYSDL